MKNKLAVIVLVIVCALACAFGLVACGNNGGSNVGNGNYSHTEHSWNGGKVTTAATCTTDGVKTYTCTVCGETRTESIPAAHDWSDVWSKDGDRHWYACKNCSKKKSDAAHKWNNGEQIKPATCTINGIKTYTCTVCDKTKTEPIPAAHKWATTWSKDDTHHWHTCNVCTEKKDNAKHTWNGDTCSTCGQEYIISGQELIKALDSNCLEIILKKCFVGMTVDKEKVSSQNWYIAKDFDGKITEADLTFKYISNSTDASFKIGKVKFNPPISAKDLKDGNITGAQYSSVYSFSYDQTIQTTRAALTNAICDKFFGVNENAKRYLYDNSNTLDDKIGEAREFKVVQITNTKIKELTFAIKLSSNDTEYINKLSNSSNYRTYAEKSYEITGIKVAGNQTAQAKATANSYNVSLNKNDVSDTEPQDNDGENTIICGCATDNGQDFGTSQVIAVISLAIAIIGVIIALWQWRQSLRRQQAEFCGDLVKQLSDKDINDVAYMIDYNIDWYGEHFDGNRELERKVDKTLRFYSYVCYLKKHGLIGDAEFDLFKYRIERCVGNEHTRNYLYNLYHFTKSRVFSSVDGKKRLCPYDDLIEYGKDHKLIRDDFYDETACDRDHPIYKHYLNF